MVKLNEEEIPQSKIKQIHNYIQIGMLQIAEVEAQKLVVSNPNDHAGYGLLGELYSKLSDHNYAASNFDKAIELSRGLNIQYYHGAASAWMLLGEQEKAIGYCQKMKQDQNTIYAGNLLEVQLWGLLNKPVKQRELLQKLPVLSKSDGNREIIESNIFIAEKLYDKAIDSLKIITENFHNIDNVWIRAQFLLAKAYDKIEEYDLAWESATRAREKIRGVGKYDPSENEKKLEDIKNFFVKSNFDILPKPSNQTILPVFIVGMARSGTTLLEQILGMHSKVTNAGELSLSSIMIQNLPTTIDSYRTYPDCLIDLRNDDVNKLFTRYLEGIDWFAKGYERVTNKSLALHEQVGFLSLILPGSSFIFLNRHPLDNGLSCYLTPLSASGSHPYTHNLQHLGRFIVARRKMLDYWKNEFCEHEPLDLRYEDLTSDQKKQTERILKYLNIPWEDNCMEFHTSNRVANTISYDQVSQKMYTSSVERWKNYEKYLQPLAEVVSEYL